MIGQRFKAWRKSKKLTQQGIATKTASSSGYISEIEQGKTRPGSNFLVSLSREFDVNLHWLLTGDGESEVGSTIKPVSGDPPELAELLEGARKVLTSGNPIAFDALERNIRYFSHAIEVEKRLQEMEAKLADIDELKRYMLELKQQEEAREKARLGEPSSEKKAA